MMLQCSIKSNVYQLRVDNIVLRGLTLCLFATTIIKRVTPEIGRPLTANTETLACETGEAVQKSDIPDSHRP